MHVLRFSDIARILDVQPTQISDDTLIDSLLTDSRKLRLPAGTLFFAINSPQKDASIFLKSLYANGVRNFVTAKDLSTLIIQELPAANIIQVEDVLHALQKLGANHRHQFHYPVIGITGSNGKTIVKEWLYQLLSNDYNIVRSPKSYNSQVGVPLSVWNMAETNTLGIFEAGISLPGEMGNLQKLIDPAIGVFTYIGNAHAEGFESMEQKIAEKLLLFKNSKILIYCADDALLANSVKSFVANVNNDLSLFTWCRNKEASLVISKVEKLDHESLIHCRYKTLAFDFIIPFTDDASIFNAITCVCVLLQLGVHISAIAANIYQLKPVEMRLELKEGFNNCSIINDSYSADLNSLGIALDFLQQQQQHEKRTLILSDLLQSGYESSELYRQIAAIVSSKNLYRFIGIGQQLTANKAAFNDIANAVFFESTEIFLKSSSSVHFENETILLKGARVFRFEKISKLLELKMHETVLEINLNAMRENLRIYRQLLNKDVKLVAMVKAFSYGSGSYEIASLLQHAAVDYLAVAYADEGVALRKAGIRLPIMVMNTEMAGFENIIQYKLEPVLYSSNILRSFVFHLEKVQKHSYPVHIKLDTGMHRLGFVPADIDELCSFLKGQQYINVLSVFSHLAASDEIAHDAFTTEQAAQFSAMANNIEQAIGYIFIRHIANTAAIHRHPQLQMNMVRLGIGLYGIDTVLNLQNVTTLKTTISQVKVVKKGETVGYSRKAVVDRDSVVAIVRIGYADGYPRLLGNGTGKMLVNENLVPVIGNVCMDMTILDITGVDAAEGDEVIVFGKELPVTTIASWAQTIPYEILTNISQRVKRVYFEE